MPLNFGYSGEAMAMLLSSDEYARGLVKWSINGGATVTVVSPGHGEDAVSSSLLTDAAGSIPDIVATKRFQLAPSRTRQVRSTHLYGLVGTACSETRSARIT